MWGLAQIRADAMCEAAVLLAMRGYDNVHASELAEASRLSVGSLYRIYGSKRGFALSVRDMSESTLCRRARISFEIEHGRPGVDFREAFFSFWRGLVAEALKEPALFAFTFLHWHPLSDGPRERYVRGPYLPRSLGPVAEDTSDADAPDARRYTRGSDGPYAPDVGERSRSGMPGTSMRLARRVRWGHSRMAARRGRWCARCWNTVSVRERWPRGAPAWARGWSGERCWNWCARPPRRARS